MVTQMTYDPNDDCDGEKCQECDSWNNIVSNATGRFGLMCCRDCGAIGMVRSRIEKEVDPNG